MINKHEKLSRYIKIGVVGKLLLLALFIHSPHAFADQLLDTSLVATSTPAIIINDCTSFVSSLSLGSKHMTLEFGSVGESLSDLIAAHPSQTDFSGSAAAICAQSVSFGGYHGDLGSSGMPLYGIYGPTPTDGQYFWIISTSANGLPPYTYTGYFLIININNGAVSISKATRITSTSPYDQQNVPTSGFFLNSDTYPWTYQASGYINPDDYPNVSVLNNYGLIVRWNVSSAAAATNNCTDAICAFNNNAQGFTYYSLSGDISSNTFSVSTTSTDVLPPDWYNLNVQLIKPKAYFGLTSVFGINFGYDVVANKNSAFKVGTTTTYQDLLHVISAPSTLNATTTVAFASSCSPLSLYFNVGDCLTYLLTPNLEDFTVLGSYVRDNILSHAPIGYATRLISILTDTASSTASTDLPTFSFSFPNTTPLFGDTITFDMQEMLSNGSTTLAGVTDPISGKNTRDIVEPWIKLFIAISALIIVFHDVMGMGKHEKYAHN